MPELSQTHWGRGQTEGSFVLLGVTGRTVSDGELERIEAETVCTTATPNDAPSMPAPKGRKSSKSDDGDE